MALSDECLPLCNYIGGGGLNEHCRSWRLRGGPFLPGSTTKGRLQTHLVAVEASCLGGHQCSWLVRTVLQRPPGQHQPPGDVCQSAPATWSGCCRGSLQLTAVGDGIQLAP